MSIEPISVSNPVMRDNDNGSLHSMGGGTQGSATGRKEGQFGSFWDKAVFGAQKLFGMHRPSNNGFEESNLESDDDSTQEEAYTENRSGVHSRLRASFCDATLGGRLSQTVRRDGMGSMPSFGSTDRSFVREESAGKEILSDHPEYRRRDSGDTTVETRANDEIQDESSEKDETEGNGEKVAARPLRPLAFIGKTTADAQSSKFLSIDSQHFTKYEKLVGINSAVQSPIDPNMSSLIANTNPQTAESSSLTPLVGEQSASNDTSASVAAMGNVKSTQANVLGKEVSALVKGSRASGEAISQLAQSANHKPTGDQALKTEVPAEARTTFGKGNGDLAFDSEKANRNLSKAFENNGSLESTRQGKASEAASSAKLVPTDLGEPAGQSKVQSTLTDGTKQDVTDFKAAEQGASKLSAAKKVDTHVHQESVREMRPVDSRSHVSRARPMNSVKAAGGISNPASTVSGNKASVEAQSQGSSSGNSVKQNLHVSAAREIAPKANVGSPKGEASQGFQFNSLSSPSSSKSEFVAKAQSASYSSKSAEEVKEVYSALSKNVDRLLNKKGESINLRINFDQGGSMALKVSMKGGQIKTLMQTDLPGLEGMIKSNWSEFAADWNAKGVKLSAPQFANSEGGQSREEGSSGFFQGETQSQNESSGNTGSRGNRRSERAVAASNSGVPQSESSPQAAESDEVVDQELKTYA